MRSKLKKAVTAQDMFGECISFHIEDEDDLNSICGGLCSILYELMFLSLFIVSGYHIMVYHWFDIKQTLKFHEIKKMNPLDFSEYIKDFVFGFKYKD